jgi:hypothetical protein
VADVADVAGAADVTGGTTLGVTTGAAAPPGAGGVTASGATSGGGAAVTAFSGPGAVPEGSGIDLIRRIIATTTAASAANPTAKTANTAGLMPFDRRGSGAGGNLDAVAPDANAAEAFTLNGAI